MQETLSLNFIRDAGNATLSDVFENEKYDLAVLQVESHADAFAATLEGRVDPGGEWELVCSMNTGDRGTGGATISADGIYEFSIAGIRQIRVRVLYVTNGGVSVSGILWNTANNSKYPQSGVPGNPFSFGDTRLFVKGAAEVIFTDPASGAICGYQKTLSGAAIQSSVNLAEITGGIGNRLVGVIPDSARITGSYTDEAFSLQTRAAIMGGNVAYDAISQTCETVKATSPTLEVSGNPVPFYGEEVPEVKLPTYAEVENVPIASVSDGEGNAPVKKLTVGIEPVQDLHGYDAPWGPGAGVNKFDKTNTFDGYISDSNGNYIASEIYKCTDYIPVVAGGSYRIITEQTTGMWGAWYDSDKNYIFGINGYIVNPVITAPSNAAYIRLTVVRNGDGNIDTFALNYPSTVTTYAPYSNICPITGWTGAKIWDDPKYGGTVEWNQLYGRTDSSTSRGINFTNANGKITVTGVNNGTGSSYYTYNFETHIPQNHIVYFGGLPSTGSSTTYDIALTAVVSGKNILLYKSATIRKLTACDYSGLNINIRPDYDADTNPLVIIPQVFDLTQMFGSTIADYVYSLEQNNEGDGVAWFRNLFPKDYYAYDAGTESCISAVNGDPYRYYPVSWQTQAGTVYGGTLDVTTGMLTVTHISATVSNFDSWEYQTANYYTGLYRRLSNLGLPNIKISNSAIFSHFRVNPSSWNNQPYGAASILQTYQAVYFWNNDLKFADSTEMKAALNALGGVQFCYELASPQTYQLTPTEIRTLTGVNNVWAETGNVAYFKYQTDQYIIEQIPTACRCYVKPVGATTESGTAYTLDSKTKQIVDFFAEPGKSYEVTYFVHNASARTLPVPTEWNPVIMTVTVRFAVFRRQGAKDSQGSFYGWLSFIAPKAILTGNAGANGSQTAIAETEGSWMALPNKRENMPSFCSCADGTPVAYYVFAPCGDENEAVTDIVLPGGGISLKAGQSVSLPLKFVMADGTLIQPDYSTVNYIAADESVATVNTDGVVTGVSEGVTQITAYVLKKSGETVSTICSVTVYGTMEELRTPRSHINFG